MVVANADQADEVAEALSGSTGSADPAEPVVQDGVAFIEAAIPGDVGATAAFDTVEDARDAVHQVDGADALVGGCAAVYLDTKVASTRDNLVIIPIVLVVVVS